MTTTKGKRALAKVHRYHVDRLAYALEDADTAALAAAVTELVHRFTAAAQTGTRRTA